MQACEKKDCEIVEGSKKMPAMNKFKALKAVGVLAGWCEAALHCCYTVIYDSHYSTQPVAHLTLQCSHCRYPTAC